MRMRVDTGNACVRACGERPEDVARFWRKVNVRSPGECWEWTAQRQHFGYGQFKMRDGRKRTAHKFAIEAATGPVPAGMFVLHKCDNPPCCNPSHLFLGTPADNMRDMWAKGRASNANHPGNAEALKAWRAANPAAFTGASHPSAKLTEADVVEIRAALASGATGVSLAKRYNVSNDTISAIRTRKKWRHVV